MIFRQGETLVATLTLRRGVTLVDPVSVALVLQLEDGTHRTPTVTNTSVGIYTATLVVDVPGRWIRKWTYTGNNADGLKESWFTVERTEVTP